jgi:hypothetical protein
MISLKLMVTLKLTLKLATSLKKRYGGETTGNGCRTASAKGQFSGKGLQDFYKARKT